MSGWSKLPKRLVHRALKGAERVGSAAGLGKLRRFRWFDHGAFEIQRRVNAWSNPGVVELHGFRMHLGKGDPLRLSLNAEYDSAVQAVAERVVKPGMTVLDVGANIGFYTLLLAKLVGPTGRVYAFEPHPANVALLRRNVAENGFAHVTVVDKAVSDGPGKVRMNVTESIAAHNIREGSPTGRSVEVETVALDDFLGADARVDFVKLDVEGVEGYVLRGMQGILKANPQLRMVAEVAPPLMDQTGIKASEAIDLLLAQGFRTEMLKRDTHEPVPVTKAEMMTFSCENVYCSR